MPNTHETLISLFSDIADAIRGKTGGTDDIVADEFPNAIRDLPSGGAVNFNVVDIEVASDRQYGYVSIGALVSQLPNGSTFARGFWIPSETEDDYSEAETFGNGQLGEFATNIPVSARTFFNNAAASWAYSNNSTNYSGNIYAGDTYRVYYTDSPLFARKA